MAASVAGVAATGFQLSQTIYNLIHTFFEAEKEMSNIANDLSLLATVLNELEVVLRRDSRVYRRRMVRAVNEILRSCEGVFQSISNYVFVDPQHPRSFQQFQNEVRWYFQRHRIRPLQAGLDAMKSTLNVLLHVVYLARVTEPNAGTVFTNADVQMERNVLMRVVLDNRRSILSLERIEKVRNKGDNFQNTVEDKREIKTNSGGFSSFGDWEERSSANTSADTGLFSKAAKGSTTDTTYSNIYPPSDNTKMKDTTSSRLEVRNFDLRDEGIEEDEAERNVAGRENDWETFTTTASEKKHRRKNKDLLDNFFNIPNPTAINITLGKTEPAADNAWSVCGVASSDDKKGKQRKDGRKKKRKKSENNIRDSRDGSPHPSVPADSISHYEHFVEVSEISWTGSSGSRQRLFCGGTEGAQTSRAGDLPSHPESQEDSPSQSPAAEYYSIPPEVPITNNAEPRYSGEDLVPQITSSAKGRNTKFSKNQSSPPGSDILTPTARWFLSIVPHESSDSALISKLGSGEVEYLRARAEETAKKLIFNWTNIDPDVISGEESIGDWNAGGNSHNYLHGLVRDEQMTKQSYETSYTPQAYPTYALQQWSPPAVLTPSPLLPPVITLPPPANQRQTDNEELARLKKLILDEKVEQDMRAAAPVATSVAPIAAEESREDTMRRRNSHMEAIDSMQMPQEHSTLWRADPPRLQPVVMRDWLGRKFIFPVDMCQTWEALHSLIQEAFGHVFEYRPIVEKGKYLISHMTGEVILPSTWKFFVQPGLEINMEVLNASRADGDDFVSKAVVSGRRDNAGPKILTPPLTPKVPTLGNPMALRSRSANEPSIGNIPDDETDCPSPQWTIHAEQADPRSLSIENLLLDQKKAKVNAEMNLERNRRFSQLRQQLLDQGAAIQARQNAAEHAEQDAKLAWLEKQVREQKEELDALPPLLMTPPSSNAGDSSRRSLSSPQRKFSLGARLLGRMPSRGIRSRGSIRSQQMMT